MIDIELNIFSGRPNLLWRAMADAVDVLSTSWR